MEQRIDGAILIPGGRVDLGEGFHEAVKERCGKKHGASAKL